MTTDLDYYLQKVADMLKFAVTAHDPQTRAEFEHLAEEYRELAKRAKETNQSQSS